MEKGEYNKRVKFLPFSERRPCMKRLPILIVIALLLTLCVAMASYLIIYHHSYEIEY